MTKEAYLKRMKQHEETMDRLWIKIVNDTNEYIRSNKPESPPHNQIEKFSDQLCLAGAWVYDRSQGKTCTTHNSAYRGSLTKKIRKALGYTI